MLLTCITLCCFVLNVQSENLQTPYQDEILNPDKIYFADNRPQAAAHSPPNILDTELTRKTIQDKQPNNNTPSFEIEKSNEIVQNTVNRRITPQMVPNQQTVQQNAVNNRKTSPSNNLLYSVTNFGVNLLKTASAKQPGNLVVSPFSITSALALLQQGALGHTQEQINTVLQMTPSASASLYSKVSEDIKIRNSRNTLKTANNLFVADGFSLNPDFKSVAQRYFDSDITPVSFAKLDLTARQINSWVASRTNNKIERLISPDALDETTQMVLVNAIYFKGLWEVPFKVESTVPRDFQLCNGQTKTAQYMRTRKLFKTGIDPANNAQVIILPFERNEYFLMVILPSHFVGLANTLSSLTDARLLSYLSFSLAETELELPKFTVKAVTDLTPILKDMGITNIFSQYANLSGLGTYRAFAPHISSAVHSAVLSIDEQGGSAAAATAFAAVALSYDVPNQFKVNRPFILVLWDNKMSVPLFMAKIEDPQV